jgi:peptide/nickel transport system substrate-binding protein
MNRKHVLFTFLIVATILISACQQAATPTVVTTTAPVVEPTQGQVVEPTAVTPTEVVAPPEKTVLTITWAEEFDSLNPLYTNMSFSTYTQPIWLGWAWQFDDQGQPYPLLVTEIPSLENGGVSADGTAITMTLRSDLTWSDGEPLTSADFRFTWEMSIDEHNAVSSAYPYSMITSIDTPDATTVIMHFDAPFAPWLAGLWHSIIPEHILKPVYDSDGTLDNAAWNTAPTVGYGPYIFDSWESGSYARFVKNPNFWGTPAKIDEIFFRFVPDETAQVNSLLAGDADLGYWVEWLDAQKLQDAGYTIDVVPNGYNEGLFFLVNNSDSTYNGNPIGHPAMLDVKVRQAIAMAIDRETLNQNLNLGFTTVPQSYWDSVPLYNDLKNTVYNYDPEGAKKLLDEAGWIDSNGDGTRDKDGVELILGYGTTDQEKRQKAQVVVQENLKAVGIGTELTSLASDLFFASYDDNGPTYTGDLDIQEWSDIQSYPDPDIYYWYCSEIPTPDYPAGTNSFYLCDEELDSLMTLQTTQLDYQERHATFQKINDIFGKQVYWLGMWQDPDNWVVSPKLQNVKWSAANPFFNIAEWVKTP